MRWAALIGMIGALVVPSAAWAPPPPLEGGASRRLQPGDYWRFSSQHAFGKDEKLWLRVMAGDEVVLRMRGRMPCRAFTGGDINVVLRLACQQSWRISALVANRSGQPVRVKISWRTLPAAPPPPFEPIP